MKSTRIKLSMENYSLVRSKLFSVYTLCVLWSPLIRKINNEMEFLSEIIFDMLVSSRSGTKLGKRGRGKTIKRVQINGIDGSIGENDLNYSRKVNHLSIFNFQRLQASCREMETGIYHLLAVSLHSMVKIAWKRGMEILLFPIEILW